MSSSSSIPHSATLTSRALIATVTFGAWRVAKAHRAETDAVNAKHGVVNVAKVGTTICDHPALLEVYRLHAEARVAHYRLTLPAADKGLRLLPINRQTEHSDMLRDYRARIDSLVAEFLGDYDRVAAEAPARLNGLYVAAHWPTKDEVAGKFAFSARYLPVPSTGQWAEWMAEAAAEAHAHLTERLSDAIVTVAKRLSEPGARTYASLTGNLAELLALTPDLNLGADPRIADIAQRAHALLEHDTDTLRDDPIARANIAQRAYEIVSLFNLT